MVRMTTARVKDGIAYRTTAGRKVALALVFAFLTWGIAGTLAEGDGPETMVAPIVLWVLCLAGMLYRECWLFLPQERKIVSLFGFGPFVRRRTIAFDAVRTLSVSHFVKGDARAKGVADRKRHRKAMVVLEIVERDETRHTIEIIPERTSAGKTERAAQTIAAVSGLPLQVDRPVDRDLRVGVGEL